MTLPDQSTAYTTLEEHGDVLIVGFKLRMLNDEENIEQLGQELFSLVEQYNRLKIALDMSNVDYLTSSVIGKLITLHRKLHRCQGKMALFGLTDGVGAILGTSKLLSYFTVADGKEAAVALFA
ncbi:MAG TPA: STAS domain-containing protein [Planctomycetaceae bacterium]|nr:STAS domain-containing protein [Planctomycetaceae bacterium]